MQTQGTWRRLVIGWTALALGGCPVDGGTTTPTGDTGGDPAATVAGDVGRTAAFGPEDDGIGTLFVAAFDVCAHDGTVLGAAVIPNADLSADDARVAWSIADLPQTTVYLASFQDDDGNADPAAPLPDVGDLVFTEDAGDGILDCVAVDLTGGDIDGVRIDLNQLEEAPTP